MPKTSGIPRTAFYCCRAKRLGGLCPSSDLTPTPFENSSGNNKREFLPKPRSKCFASIFWKLWYPVLTDLLKRTPIDFLNYGYADAGDCGLKLEPRDEPDRPCIRLYHRVAGAIDLTGLRVLEISCGHGGGSSYIARYLKVRSLHAIDQQPQGDLLLSSTARYGRIDFLRPERTQAWLS